jgi:hypothetical protein
MAPPTLNPRDQRIEHAGPNSRIGAGLMQWNRGGWFGSQFGCTLWLGLCGGAVVGHDLGAGLMILGCFLAANAIGCLLWSQRAKIPPHLAIQLLCFTSFCAAAVSFALLYEIGIAQEIADSSASGLPLPLWSYLAIYPALMAFLAFMDRSARGRA